jgi:HEAT repeat protein
MPPKSGLQARSATERLDAVKALAKQLDTDPEILITALEDKSNLVVAAAATALGDRWQDIAIEPLTQCYERLSTNGVKRDPGCTARIAIVKALAQCRAHSSVHVFFHAIKTVQSERVGDTAVPLRVQAAVALALLRPSGALLALSVLLFDVEPHVPYAPEDRLYVQLHARVTAAQGMAVLGDPGAVAVLGVKLTFGQDELPEVLLECMDALVQLDSRAALELLPQYLQHRNEYLCVGAATALASLPHPEVDDVVPLLVTALTQAPTGAQAALALALASVRSDASVLALAELAEHPILSLRLAAVEALKQRGDPPAIEALAQIVRRTGDKQVVQAAKRALDELP